MSPLLFLLASWKIYCTFSLIDYNSEMLWNLIALPLFNITVGTERTNLTRECVDSFMGHLQFVTHRDGMCRRIRDPLTS